MVGLGGWWVRVLAATLAAGAALLFGAPARATPEGVPDLWPRAVFTTRESDSLTVVTQAGWGPNWSAQGLLLVVASRAPNRTSYRVRTEHFQLEILKLGGEEHVFSRRGKESWGLVAPAELALDPEVGPHTEAAGLPAGWGWLDRLAEVQAGLLDVLPAGQGDEAEVKLLLEEGSLRRALGMDSAFRVHGTALVAAKPTPRLRRLELELYQAGLQEGDEAAPKLGPLAWVVVTYRPDQWQGATDHWLEKR